MYAGVCFYFFWICLVFFCNLSLIRSLSRSYTGSLDVHRYLLIIRRRHSYGLLQLLFVIIILVDVVVVVATLYCAMPFVRFPLCYPHVWLMCGDYEIRVAYISYNPTVYYYRCSFYPHFKLSNYFLYIYFAFSCCGASFLLRRSVFCDFFARFARHLHTLSFLLFFFLTFLFCVCVCMLGPFFLRATH